MNEQQRKRIDQKLGGPGISLGQSSSLIWPDGSRGFQAPGAGMVVSKPSNPSELLRNQRRYHEEYRDQATFDLEIMEDLVAGRVQAFMPWSRYWSEYLYGGKCPETIQIAIAQLKVIVEREQTLVAELSSKIDPPIPAIPVSAYNDDFSD